MRLKTKLFLTSVGAMLVLWIGAFLLIQNVVNARIDQMAQEAFAGTEQGLAVMQKARVEQMQQAGRLVMNIPELRALIAEENYEISDENSASLEERLDHLNGVVGASFVTVLDQRRNVIAQSHRSPWTTIQQLKQFCVTSAEPAALIRSLFTRVGTADTDGDGAGRAESGLWAYDGTLYHVVAIPLIFQSDASPRQNSADGALILGEKIDDAASRELARGHNGEVTFFASGRIVASSLEPRAREKLAKLYAGNSWPPFKAFLFKLDATTFHGSIDVLRDAPSGTSVGQVLIQCDEQDATIEAKVLQNLLLIMAAGVVVAGIGSFVISDAIGRPVRELVGGVQSVAGGKLDIQLPTTRRDELGLLATSFNDMVVQLRSRRELEQKVEKAQSASRAKSQFLANMSHEIRTPLNGVIGMTELMLGTKLSEQQRRFATLAKTSGELLASLINDILDFSKIEAGKMEVECIEFNLHETIEEVIALLSERATHKKLELACHFHRDVPARVIGDPARIRQVVVNLVNNALKFTESGSVVASLNVESGDETEVVVRCSVTDTGIGIPADRRERLFKPFTQVDASTTRKYGGTGLGLAIVKQLAELMGGSVGVESESGRGSTFWFTVRLGRRAEPQAVRTGRMMRVLVVDDSRTTRDILHEQLQSWGIAAVLTDGASAALNALRASAAVEPFTVALIDSDLPGADELVRTIKDDASIASSALIALMPLERGANPDTLRAIGFAGRISKPIRRSQLFDGLMRVVAHESEHADRAEGTPANVTAGDASAPAPAARILVAEDNEVNQIVITELLARAGYRCTCVDSGTKVIAAVFAGGYDVVLMDCQMPEIDGFEATRIIRQREIAQKSRRLPIIALTANAMKGDREQCLAAGMDAYCSKPVNDRHLRETITSLLAARGDAKTNSDAAHSPVENAPQAIKAESNAAPACTDLPPILVDALLQRCMNNAAMADRLLGKFEVQAARDLGELEKLIAAGDASAVARIAHSLKGAAAILAAGPIASIAAELEELGRHTSIDGMDTQLNALRQEVDRCIAYLPTARAVAAQHLATKHPQESKLP